MSAKCEFNCPYFGRDFRKCPFEGMSDSEGKPITPEEAINGCAQIVSDSATYDKNDRRGPVGYTPLR